NCVDFPEPSGPSNTTNIPASLAIQSAGVGIAASWHRMPQSSSEQFSAQKACRRDDAGGRTSITADDDFTPRSRRIPLHLTPITANPILLGNPVQLPQALRKWRLVAFLNQLPSKWQGTQTPAGRGGLQTSSPAVSIVETGGVPSITPGPARLI